MRPSLFLQGAALIVAIALGIAQTSASHGRLILYVGDGLALLLFLIAVVVSNRELAKPRIVAVRYGRDKSEGRYGLTVVNESESSAFDISIQKGEIPVGSARLVFLGSGVSRLTKDGGEALVEAFIKLPSRITMMGDALFDEMVKHNLSHVVVKITYKDGDGRWYESVCKIERDVHAKGGITTRFVKQRRIWKLFRHK